MSIHEYLAAPSVDLPALAAFLDHLDASARLREIRSLLRREQAKLFSAAANVRPISLAHFVPDGTPPLRAVVHHGRNSLVAFHDFEKRFCRPEAGANELWGYNEQPQKALTGPGYFVARQTNDYEVLVDYYETPPARPAAWPPIRPNSAGLSRFIFYHTRDIVRGVSQHVSIGRAAREGKLLDNWFVLCRADD
jgi:hypothetical protein